MRNRGPNGGGTLCSGAPQLLHCSRGPASGRTESARSQCPRASHVGLMHCTVQPGKYCKGAPPEKLFLIARILPKSACGNQEQTTTYSGDIAQAVLLTLRLIELQSWQNPGPEG